VVRRQGLSISIFDRRHSDDSQSRHARIAGLFDWESVETYFVRIIYRSHFNWRSQACPCRDGTNDSGAHDCSKFVCFFSAEQNCILAMDRACNILLRFRRSELSPYSRKSPPRILATGEVRIYSWSEEIWKDTLLPRGNGERGTDTNAVWLYPGFGYRWLFLFQDIRAFRERRAVSRISQKRIKRIVNFSKTHW
jgi:hypothetical protein